MEKAQFHLPGLFEFWELYRLFLPLYRRHPAYFYDWCSISSIYGAPADCIWGGGRVGFGECRAEDVLALTQEYGISARLTFSNSLLKPEHLSDPKCNRLCNLFSQASTPSGAIVHSDLLTQYLTQQYPDLYLVSSTTKVLTKLPELAAELERPEFSYVVPDFRLNPALAHGAVLPHPEKIELLCNECCDFGCTQRKQCYENVSRKNLGLMCEDHICPAGDSYRFSHAMNNPGFISPEAILRTYLPRGISNFKLEGRSLGSALVLEILLYYLVQPAYQIHVREAIYLDASLDLF